METTHEASVTAPLTVHWPEVLLEGLGLGLFMISAGVFGTLLEHPGGALREALPDPTVRRALMGVVMGLTALGLVYSPWGKRSGAHLNPAFTATMLRLGRVRAGDAVAYVTAQFIGGLAGVLLVAAVFGDSFLGPPVSGVATSPGPAGPTVAFVSEFTLSFSLMLMVLSLGGSRLGRFTGLFVGAAVFLFITLEAPLSGMSMNPARSLASAVPTGRWEGLWIYFAAPLAGMLLASEVHVRLAGSKHAGCAKVVHALPCIFCGGGDHRPRPRSPGSGKPTRSTGG